MKRLAFMWIWVLLAGFAVSGCTHIDKVRTTEGDLSIPYESMGTLEVKIRTRSLGSTSPEKRKAMLDDKLSQESKKHFAPDALIHATYWPDLQSRSFPGGYMYARAEMVRYKPFPEPEPAEESQAGPLVSEMTP